MSVENVPKIQSFVTSAQEGVYRAAFPAFRVFIYGQEVSGDVVEVRVNQSGGSMDRSPSTCSISLVNTNDKYIIDHNDMIAIQNGREALINKLSESVTAYYDNYCTLPDDSGVKGDVLSEYMRILSSDSRFSPLNAEIDDLYQTIKAFQGSDEGRWLARTVPDRVKLSTLSKKSLEIIPNWSKFQDNYKSDYLYKGIFEGSTSAKYVYPLTEGDCIFHPNDPVRVAFRDPFVPQIWYWMFAGFVDGFVEDRGVNQDSIVTINCTDVTKVARYSFFQLDVGATRDPNLAALFPIFEGVLSTTKWVAYQNLFATFSIYDILEILFFGIDDYSRTLNFMTEQFLKDMDDDEANIYLMNTATKMSIDQIKALTRTERDDLVKTYVKGKRTERFAGAELPALATPRGDVRFQRKSIEHGVYALFLGIDKNSNGDSLEASMGEFINNANLKKINDYFQHRVTSEDFSIMGKTSDDKKVSSKNMSMNDIVSYIGLHQENYPVGGGRVFYVAPSGLAMGTASGILDEMVAGGGGSLHSEYKDRLTFLYDVAEQIQFCFYATPKGDVVFEMPFYDFDPWMFSDNSSFVANTVLADVTKLARERLDSWAKGSTKYTAEEIAEMMELSSNLTMAEEGFSFYDMDDLDYSSYYIIDKNETYGFSNALSDSGLKTMGRCTPKNVEKQGEGGQANDTNSRETQFVVAPELAALLGFRPASEKSAWTFVTSDEGARVMAAIDLRRSNSEARSLNIQVLPHFGLMVNRPLYWRQRNYVANIVSCQHSIVVNSSCETQVNVNYARGWKGEYHDGGEMEIFRHFGGDLPFSYVTLLKNASTDTWKQPGVNNPHYYGK